MELKCQVNIMIVTMILTRCHTQRIVVLIVFRFVVVVVL